MTTCQATPGCGGTIDENGFCDECGLAAQPAAPSVPTVSSTSPTTTATTRSTRTGGVSDPFSLPVFSFPDPSSRIIRDPKIPDRHRRCRDCGTPVGRAYQGQPGLTRGACPQCGLPYSFEPSLRKGDLVGGQYRVAGCFARGGIGWIYLAYDENLDNDLVVLKGLIDVGNASMVVAERRALTTLNHPNIVGIRNFVRHPDQETGEDRDYIVMEYVDGLSLRQLCEESAKHLTPLGEPLLVEHVIACGLQILAAFEYLHLRRLLYCDMKPDNVIMRSGQHGERVNRVKLIDLGAVRAFDDRTSRIVGTERYQVGKPEIDSIGLTVRSDLYTVGRTLADLFEASVDSSAHRGPDNPVEIGIESFRLVIARATADHEHRFTSAAQMADQLRGVHRRISALRDGKPRPEPSTVFAPAAALLDAGLGNVPALDRWLCDDRPDDGPAALPVGTPAPATVATRLPVPYADPDDQYADFVTDVDAAEPLARLGKLTGHQSVEVDLARCRACLELGDPDAAAEHLDEVRHVPEEWRLRWHQGLVALATDGTAQAREFFEAVHAALPGEDTPLLALAYCLEESGSPVEARQHYRAVWQRDRGQAGAAFGLARLALADGNRSAALTELGRVPTVSRHVDAAGIARVLVRSHPVAGEPPSEDDLERAAVELPRLYLDGGDPDGEARARLTAVVREAVRWWLRDNGRRLPVDGGVVFGREPDERTIRRLLEKSYQAMARQARNADAHGVLVDRANAVRPITFL